MVRKRAPGGGRKPKAPAERKSEYLQVRVTAETREFIERESKKSGRSLSGEITEHLEEAAKRAKNPYLKEVFHLLELPACRLGENWQSDPWLRQAFKASCRKLLDYVIPDAELSADAMPTTIRKIVEGHDQLDDDLTPDHFGILLADDVLRLLETVPDELPSSLPAKAMAYSMPGIRNALGLQFSPVRAMLIQRLARKPRGGNR